MAFPGRPSLGLGGGASNPKRGHRGGGAGREAGAGENPPGRHPEWLISADESLFSFRLNTLNRAPSDVYLHSLRANAGGGPKRLQGHAGVGGCRELRGLLRGGDGGVGEERGVSRTQRSKSKQPGALRPSWRRGERNSPWSAFLPCGPRQSGQVGCWRTVHLSTQALEPAALCVMGAVVSSFNR